PPDLPSFPTRRSSDLADRASGAKRDADDLVSGGGQLGPRAVQRDEQRAVRGERQAERSGMRRQLERRQREPATVAPIPQLGIAGDRKSTRLNSSHDQI